MAAEPTANRLIYLGVLLVVLGVVPGSPVPVLAGVAVFGLGIVLLGASFALRFLAGRPHLPGQDAAVALAFPLRGRWEALNGPAERVPSHRTHSHGQSFAVDFVRAPEGYERPDLGWGLIPPRPDAYPGFGDPVLSPVAGTVVRARDGIADGRTRTTWPAIAWMLSVEAVLRTAATSDRLVGNHVVLRADGGFHVVLAHLRRGTVVPAAGDAVAVGEEIGRCGSSGNSAEPHLHLHVMDHPRPLVGVGRPFRFVDAVDDAGGPVGVPPDGEGVREAPAPVAG